MILLNFMIHIDGCLIDISIWGPWWMRLWWTRLEGSWHSRRYLFSLGREMLGGANLHAHQVTSQLIVYTLRERHPPGTEFEAVQDESGPSEAVARRCTRRQDDEDVGHDEPRLSQPPARMYWRRRGAEEARPSQQYTPLESQAAPCTWTRMRTKLRAGRLSHELAYLLWDITWFVLLWCDLWYDSKIVIVIWIVIWVWFELRFIICIWVVIFVEICDFDTSCHIS